MEIVFRAAIVFFFLWSLTRAMGKRELVQMTAFELVLLVVVGDLVQQGVTQEDMSLTGAVIAVGTIALLSVSFSWLSFRFARTRPLLEGHAVVLLRDGEPLIDALREERVALDELREAARNEGIADLGDVRLAIMEPDGRMSFISNGTGDATRDAGSSSHDGPVV